jgi:sensor c-di-GMP phosphodiesterase-like protein
MMLALKKSVRFTSMAAVIAAAIGAGGGYLLARAIATAMTETRLEQYAARIVTDGEASSAELRTVLAAVAASPNRPCSNADIGYFRALIFESEYLKDAGRMHNGRIQCSAALGRQERPRAQPEPDFTLQDGTEIYKNLHLYPSSDMTNIALQQGGSFVVFNPLTRMHLEPAPLHITQTVTDSPTQRPGRLLGEPSAASVPTLTAEGVARVGDALYATRCSIRFFNCVTAFTSIDEVVAANRPRFAGCIGLCALLGALAGVVISLLYRRNKSPEQQLRRAISKDGLRVVYQPIVDLAYRRIVGAEALVRWTDEEGVAVGPDVFVRIAEERGFVGEITRLVLRHALRDFAAVLRSHPDFRLSINVAATDLSDPRFLPMLVRALKKASVPAQSLAIEITESSTARHEVAMKTISRLRKRGFSVHIDDFGTGYSSLAYLHDLSVNAIKIDKAFTQAIGTGSVVVAILPQILAMAQALHLEVIVEGIETELQASYFAAYHRPVLAQGWLFGRPVSAAEFPRLPVADLKRAVSSVDTPSRSVSPKPVHAA